jgi:hypothetical protein
MPATDHKAVRSIPVTPAEPAQPEKKKHKGFFGRIRDIFK